MIIEIEAVDTLFFRDGKPFNKGDDVWATGMFPPLPSVIYGVLRSAYLGQNDIALDDIRKETENLRIRNIWYEIKGRNEQRETNFKYLPSPLDLVQKKELSRIEKIRAEEYALYNTHKMTNMVIDVPSSAKETVANELLIFTEKIGIESIQDTFITDDKFINYLSGEQGQPVEVYQFAPQSEPKIGIARNNSTRTTTEGNLYRVGMLRTDEIKIWVEFDGLKLNKEGVLGIGAENKLAQYKTPKLAESLRIGMDDLTSRGASEFKLCLTTPAIFYNGYYPTEIFKKAKVEVELLTCAVGKPICVGGFDMEVKEPKEMFKAVPAGSCYYFRLISGSLANLNEVIKAYNVSEERGEEGFGVAFIGKI